MTYLASPCLFLFQRHVALKMQTTPRFILSVPFLKDDRFLRTCKLSSRFILYMSFVKDRLPRNCKYFTVHSVCVFQEAFDWNINCLCNKSHPVSSGQCLFLKTPLLDISTVYATNYTPFRRVSSCLRLFPQTRLFEISTVYATKYRYAVLSRLRLCSQTLYATKWHPVSSCLRLF